MPWYGPSTIRQTVLRSALHRLIDDHITKRLKHYLEVGTGPDGRERSVLEVTDDYKIKIERLFVKPERVDEILGEHDLPVRVVMAHCKEALITIPWGSLMSGNYCLELEELQLVVVPRERGEWSVDDIRRCKEQLIRQEVDKLLARLDAVSSAGKSTHRRRRKIGSER